MKFAGHPIGQQSGASGRSGQHEVNEALRRGLTPGARRAPSSRYRVRPHVAAVLPGIDRAKLNALADEREDLALVAKLRAHRAR